MKPHLTLIEYQPVTLPIADLPQTVAHQLAAQPWVQVRRLLFEEMWQISNRGYVGQVPLREGWQLSLLPKMTWPKLWQMISYVYQWRDFPWREGLVQAEAWPEFIDLIARQLARLTLIRLQQGLQRDYQSQTARLPYLRGRLDLTIALRDPLAVNLPSTYPAHTTDIPDNRIVLWTLYLLAHGDLPRPETRRLVQQAYRQMVGQAVLVPQQASDCVGRVYHRLNQPYRALHALCRFILAQQQPGLDGGRHDSLPFVLNAAQLFQQFVTAWLTTNQPDDLCVTSQERILLDEIGQSTFRIDLVLSARTTGQPLVVLDLKYKQVDKPSSTDIQQVAAYAAAKQCRDAILLYPTLPRFSHPRRVGDITVRCLAFKLDVDVDEAGQAFWAQLRG